jgi:hypothetical protein
LALLFFHALSSDVSMIEDEPSLVYLLNLMSMVRDKSAPTGVWVIV